MIGVRKTAGGYFYISLEQPFGDKYTALIQEAKAQVVDDVHSTLFYLRPDIAESSIQKVVDFIQGTVQSQSFNAKALLPQAFENMVTGYRFDLDPGSKEQLLKAAAVFAKAKLIDSPQLGDQIDRQNGNLHMGIFAPIREDAMYRRVIASLKKYIGMDFKFGDVNFERNAMKKTSLNKTSAIEFRKALASWSDEELTNGFFPGLYDEGVDERGTQISAADLILDEWMMRSGCYDDIRSANVPSRNDGDDDRVEYNQFLKNLRDSRVAAQADDESLYR